MKTKLLILTLILCLFCLTAKADVFSQRAVTAQTFSSANGTVSTQTDDRSVTLIASGATVATIAGVSITMIAGEVIPIQAQSQDKLRSFTITVASGALIVIEVR